MSLQIRYLTNGQKEVFTVSNTGVEPPTFEIFEKREDIDERIRHYAPTGKPVFCLPDLARTFGILDLFYPNHPINLNCVLPEYEGRKCIWESCKYNVDSKESERGTCPRNNVTKMEWISVKDKMPKDNVSVIICTEGINGKIIMEARYSESIKEFFSPSCLPIRDYGADRPITHWMPLPEPPQE